MARIYLDTSFVSACVTTRKDPTSTYRKETSNAWLATQFELHKVHISPEVVDELSDPAFAARDAALRMVEHLPLLQITDQVIGVAEVFVRENLMLAPAAAGDAVHVAVCTVHAIEYLLSWNVRHLANPNKIRHLQVICRRLGLIPPSIMTPETLWEDEP